MVLYATSNHFLTIYFLGMFSRSAFWKCIRLYPKTVFPRNVKVCISDQCISIFWEIVQNYTAMVLIFVMYVMKLRIHHILQCHFVIQKIQSTSKEEAGGLLLNMTISLDTGLLSGHCSSLPKRSEKESTHTNRKKCSKNHATFQIQFLFWNILKPFLIIFCLKWNIFATILNLQIQF